MKNNLFALFLFLFAIASLNEAAGYDQPAGNWIRINTNGTWSTATESGTLPTMIHKHGTCKEVESYAGPLALFVGLNTNGEWYSFWYNGSIGAVTGVVIDACWPLYCYADADSDSYGDQNDTTVNEVYAYTCPAGEIDNNNDCDDSRSDLTTDCSETICYKDGDGDTFRLDATETSRYYNALASSCPAGETSSTTTDCDDSYYDTSNSCTQITCYTDSDGDGFTVGSGILRYSCNAGETSASSGTDCDDTDASVNTSCTTIDCYTDNDTDGYGAGMAVATTYTTCEVGYSDRNDDCDDTDPTKTTTCTACLADGTTCTQGFDCGNCCNAPVGEDCVCNSYTWVASCTTYSSDRGGCATSGSDFCDHKQHTTYNTCGGTYSCTSGTNTQCNGASSTAIYSGGGNLYVSSYCPATSQICTPGETRNAAFSFSDCPSVGKNYYEYEECDSSGSSWVKITGCVEYVDCSTNVESTNNCPNPSVEGTVTCYTDADGDGWTVGSGTSKSTCGTGETAISDGTDCDDTDATKTTNCTATCNQTDGGLADGTHCCKNVTTLDPPSCGQCCNAPLTYEACDPGQGYICDGKLEGFCGEAHPGMMCVQ